MTVYNTEWQFSQDFSGCRGSGEWVRGGGAVVRPRGWCYSLSIPSINALGRFAKIHQNNIVMYICYGPWFWSMVNGQGFKSHSAPTPIQPPSPQPPRHVHIRSICSKLAHTHINMSNEAFESREGYS